jgi:hypothetical protein
MLSRQVVGSVISKGRLEGGGRLEKAEKISA